MHVRCAAPSSLRTTCCSAAIFFFCSPETPAIILGTVQWVELRCRLTAPSAAHTPARTGFPTTLPHSTTLPVTCTCCLPICYLPHVVTVVNLPFTPDYPFLWHQTFGGGVDLLLFRARVALLPTRIYSAVCDFICCCVLHLLRLFCAAWLRCWLPIRWRTLLPRARCAFTDFATYLLILFCWLIY